MYEFKSKSIVKCLLWGLIVISVIAGFCYITAIRVSLISRYLPPLLQRELEFPAVTVCSLSFLDTTVLKDFSNDQYRVSH